MFTKIFIPCLHMKILIKIPIFLIFYAVNLACNAYSDNLTIFKNENPQQNLSSKLNYARHVILNRNIGTSAWIAYKFVAHDSLCTHSFANADHSSPDRMGHGRDSVKYKEFMAKMRCFVEFHERALFVKVKKLGDELLLYELYDINTALSNISSLQTIFWFGSAETDQSIDFLNQLLSNSPTISMKLSIVHVLAQHQRSARLIQTFESILADDYEMSVKSKLIYKLANLKDEQSDNILLKYLHESRNTRLKKTIIQSLCQSENEVILSNLIYIVDSNEDITVRKEAIFSLCQSRNNMGIEHFKNSFNHYTNLDLKKFILFSLSQSENKSAKTALKQILANPANLKLKEEANEWISIF